MRNDIQAEHEKVKVGDIVTFYDCEMANKAKDYSGRDERFWPNGKVIKTYFRPQDGWLADVQRNDGTVSKAHFISGIKTQTP